MITELPITFDEQAIALLCQRHHILKLSLFGSVSRDDFNDGSDVDALVEFEPGRTPGFGFVDIQDELESILHRSVDLNTPKFISEYFREEVISKALAIYVRA